MATVKDVDLFLCVGIPQDHGAAVRNAAQQGTLQWRQPQVMDGLQVQWEKVCIWTSKSSHFVRLKLNFLRYESDESTTAQQKSSLTWLIPWPKGLLETLVVRLWRTRSPLVEPEAMELSLALNDTHVTSSLWSYETGNHSFTRVVVKYFKRYFKHAFTFKERCSLFDFRSQMWTQWSRPPLTRNWDEELRHTRVCLFWWSGREPKVAVSLSFHVALSCI